MADLEVAVHIDAPPGRGVGAHWDPTRMGEWSPETHRVVRGTLGHNRAGMEETVANAKAVAEANG